MAVSLSGRSFGRVLIVSVAVVVSILWASRAHAADRYWVGARNANSDRWEDTENWSTQPRGASGASLPGASDIAIFSFSGSTARIRSAVSVQGILLSNVWTGALLQGTGTITAGSAGVRVGSGRFVGGNAFIAIATGFTQTGGIVSGIQNTLTLSGSLSITDGSAAGTPSFTSTGTIVFDGNADQNFTKGSSTSMSLRNLTLENSGAGTSDDIVTSINGGLNLSGALTITVGNLDLESNNTDLVVERGITIASNAQASLTSGGNVTASGSLSVGASGSFTLSGVTTLTMNGIDQNLDTNNSLLFNLTVASSSGTTLTSQQSVSNTLQINTGSTLALDSFTFFATGATILNYAKLHEDTGKVVHNASSFLMGDSNFTEVGTFNTGDRIYVTLTDTDENIDGTALDTVSVTLSTTGGGDSEAVTLTETSKTSGLFRGSIGTAFGAVLSDGLIGATDTTTVTATNTDAQDGLVNTDTATLNVGGLPVSGSSSSGGGGGGGGGGSRKAKKVQGIIQQQTGVRGGQGQQSLQSGRKKPRRGVRPSRRRGQMVPSSSRRSR